MAYGDRDGFATFPVATGVTFEGNLIKDVERKRGDNYDFISGVIACESRFDKKTEEATSYLVSFTINNNRSARLEDVGTKGKRLSVTGDLYFDKYNDQFQLKMRASGVNESLRFPPKGEGGGSRGRDDRDDRDRSPRDEERSSRRDDDGGGRSERTPRDRGERTPRDRGERSGGRSPRDEGNVDDEY